MSTYETCTVCQGEGTQKYKSKRTGRQVNGACHRCNGTGDEPVLGRDYGGTQGYCEHCTVIGGAHRTACPAR